MNDKDLDTFEKWLEIEFGEEVDKSRSWTYEKSIFRFACEYKQKEIDELETFVRADAISTNWENKEYQEAVHYNWLDDEIRRVEHHNFNLQAENKKLREALESIAFYDEPDADKESYWQNISQNKLPSTMATDTFIAREALKEVEEK